MSKTSSKSPTNKTTASRVVEISREPVELYKILKFEGLAGSGGEAKAAVAAGRVLLNGAIEIQKRKKIVSGDIIEFGDDKLCIKFVAAASSDVTAENIKPKPVAKKKPPSRKPIPALSKGRLKK